MPNVELLKGLKNQIEIMEKTHQIEILKLLKQSNNVVLNENKSGVYVNLTYCPDDTINEIIKYIAYTKDQEVALNEIEEVKDNVKIEYFNNAATI